LVGTRFTGVPALLLNIRDLVEHTSVQLIWTRTCREA
jgi:hypothetical protein